MRLPNRPRAGELPVASAGVEDEYWAQTVILLLDTDDGGALGVILNHHALTPLDEVLPQWTDLVTPPQILFAGGPMSTDGAVCLARLAHSDEEPPGWRRIVGDLGLLHLDTPVELAMGAYEDLRIFAGYAGWEPGQLEAEIVRGDWHRVPLRDEDVFAADQDGLWRRVLRRQGGDLAWFSTWVADPESN